MFLFKRCSQFASGWAVPQNLGHVALTKLLTGPTCRTCCKRYGTRPSHGLVCNPTRTGQHASRLALQQSKRFSVSAPSVPQCTHSSHLQLERAENMQAVSTSFLGERRSKTCVADCQSVSACQRIISISGRGKAAFAEPPRQQRASCKYPLVPLLVRLASNSCY